MSRDSDNMALIQDMNRLTTFLHDLCQLVLSSICIIGRQNLKIKQPSLQGSLLAGSSDL